MNSTFVKSTIAGAVTLFIVGFLVFGLALSSFYENNMGSATGVIKNPPGLVLARSLHARHGRTAHTGAQLERCEGSRNRG